jgi:tripartite-type tricarboxylate transporter receptor subunit TctC
MRHCRAEFGAIFAVALALAPLQAAQGETAQEFYAKNGVTIVVGYHPGGGYDLYARMAAKHLQKHFFSAPNIIVKNVPGVGSLKAANYLYQQAPRDGATLGAVTQSIGLQQVLKHKAVRYDTRKFEFIGRMAQATELTVVWHTVPVKSIADARKREVMLGATSSGSSTDTNPRLMNEIAGTRFKPVLGYKGSTGGILAMERGEVEGALAVAQSLLVTKKDWIRDKKIRVLVQYALERHPAFPDAPAMTEFGETKEDKEIMMLFGSTAAVGRALLVPPGVPADRLAFLRGAFDAMVKDPDFLKDMTGRNMELDALSGEKLQALVASTFNISPEAAARAAAARTPPKK